MRKLQPIVNTPQFPGWQKGNAPEKVREFIKDQVRRKGYRLSGGNTAQDFNLGLSGTARYLYGLALVTGQTTGLATLKVNNEVVWENVDLSFLNFGQTEQDYYAVNRPLSGQDDIILTITGDAGYQNMPLVAIYK
jgi:hypothetical protein